MGLVACPQGLRMSCLATSCRAWSHASARVVTVLYSRPVQDLALAAAAGLPRSQVPLETSAVLTVA